MAVSTTSPQVSYTGDGSATVFVVPYKFFANGDLGVIRIPAGTTSTLVQVQGVDYTVTGAGVDAGGSITMTVAPHAGDVLTITRTTAQTQSTVLPTQGPFVPKAITDMSDRVTMELQEFETNVAAQIAALAAQVANPPPAQTIFVNSARQNLVLNGGFELAQRPGASFSKTPTAVGSPAFLMDRWLCSAQFNGGTFSQTAPPVLGFALQPMYQGAFNVASGGTGDKNAVLYQEIDRDFISQNRGRTFTLSAWVRGTVALGAAVSGYVFSSDSTTGRIQNFPNTGTTPNGYSVGNTQELALTTNGYAKFSFTLVNFGQFTISQSTSALCVMFVFQFAALGGGAFFEITGVQANPGATVLAPHQYVGGSSYAEQLECQRYFEKSYELGDPPGTIVYLGSEQGAVMVDGLTVLPRIRYRVSKRATAPTVALYDPASGGAFVMTVATNSAEGYTCQKFTASGTQLNWHWTSASEI